MMMLTALLPCGKSKLKTLALSRLSFQMMFSTSLNYKLCFALLNTS